MIDCEVGFENISNSQFEDHKTPTYRGLCTVSRDSPGWRGQAGRDSIRPINLQKVTN